MKKVEIWSITGIITLSGFIGLAYAELEDSGNWYSKGSGTCVVEQGELSVQAGYQDFYVTKKVEFDDNFTFSLKATTISPEDNDIVVLFCDGHYKLVLGGWRNTKIGLYKSNHHFTGEWIAMRENNQFRITPDRWYNIEIVKEGEYITVWIDQEEILRTIDINYVRGNWIGVGTYNSHVHFDNVEVLKEKMKYSELPDKLWDVTVYPNPVKLEDKYVVFGNPIVPEKKLTSQSTIRIYNTAGELVKTIEESDGDGRTIWDITNNEGKTVASGIYIYYITNPEGQKCTDKIGVIK